MLGAEPSSMAWWEKKEERERQFRIYFYYSFVLFILHVYGWWYFRTYAVDTFIYTHIYIYIYIYINTCIYMMTFSNVCCWIGILDLIWGFWWEERVDTGLLCLLKLPKLLTFLNTNTLWHLQIRSSNTRVHTHTNTSPPPYTLPLTQICPPTWIDDIPKRIVGFQTKLEALHIIRSHLQKSPL